MAPPLVSIFLPTFNHALYVEASIRSALEQDYPRLQIVVGDDGSDDDTPAIVARLAEAAPDRITAIVGEPHLGIVGNFNRILRACEGELIAFLGGDDVYLPGKISSQVATMVANPGLALSCHDVEAFDSTSGRKLFNWYERHRRPGPEAEALVKYGNPFHPLGTMVRRGSVPSDGFDSRLPIVNDWKFFVDCCKGLPAFAFVDGVWARYRDWTGNVSKWESEILGDLLRTLEIVAGEYPWLDRACRLHRASLRYSQGMSALGRGDLAAGRANLQAALRSRTWFPKALAARAIIALPAAMAMPVVRLGQRLRGAFR